MAKMARDVAMSPALIGIRLVVEVDVDSGRLHILESIPGTH